MPHAFVMRLRNDLCVVDLVNVMSVQEPKSAQNRVVADATRCGSSQRGCILGAHDGDPDERISFARVMRALLPPLILIFAVTYFAYYALRILGLRTDMEATVAESLHSGGRPKPGVGKSSSGPVVSVPWPMPRPSIASQIRQ